MSLISVIASMARGSGGVYTPPEPEIPNDLIPPAIVSIVATSATNIRIVFSETVTVTTAGWTFNNGTTVVPSAATLVSGTIWDFTVAGLVNGQVITASYAENTGSTVDTAGNEVLPFTSAMVINAVPEVVVTPSLDDFNILDCETSDFE